MNSRAHERYSNRVPFSDTSPQARAVQQQLLARMTPSERVRLGVALFEAGHALQWAAARRRHPDADDREIAYRIAVTRYGDELARRAYGKD
jgi:hypothetical protein